VLALSPFERCLEQSGAHAAPSISRQHLERVDVQSLNCPKGRGAI
jgi:hypothetical protein